jgi:hypothetical protein
MFLATSTPPSIVTIKLGELRRGTLEPENRQQREHCYRIELEPTHQLKVDLQAQNSGTIELSLYSSDRDRTHSIDRLTNPTNSEATDDSVRPVSKNFTLPATGDRARLFCLTTSNRKTPQKYKFTITDPAANYPLVIIKDLASGFPSQPALPTPEIMGPPNSPIAAKQPTPAKSSSVSPPPPPPPLPVLTDRSETALAPEPNACYLGSWQVTDLSQYWLPTLQHMTQAQITNSTSKGTATLILSADGSTKFTAQNYEQKYILKKKTQELVAEPILKLQGDATASYKVQPNRTLLFTAQTYQQLNSQFQFGNELKFDGRNLFLLYGDRRDGTAGLPYDCIDRRTLKLFIPLPAGSRMMPITLKRLGD